MSNQDDKFMSNQDDFKASIDHWAEKWDKALKDGIFKDEKPLVTTPQTSTDSYWGMIQSNPSERASDVDTEYWKKVAVLSDKYGQGYAADPLELMSEVAAVRKQRGEMVGTVASTPNPIRHGTTGMDQSSDPKSLGMTYSDENINKLNDLKVKLHDLIDKLNMAEGNGAKTESFASQIESLKKKIDELSNSMSNGEEIDQQGD